MAHLVTLFIFTFYAVIQANSKSVKIAENTFLKAKRQQYTLGKVVHCLFNINLYLADFLKTNLAKFAVIWAKKRQKACFSPGAPGFLKPEKLQNHSNAGKGKEEKIKKQWLHS